MIKKVITVLLVVAVVFSFTSCSSTAKKPLNVVIINGMRANSNTHCDAEDIVEIVDDICDASSGSITLVSCEGTCSITDTNEITMPSTTQKKTETIKTQVANVIVESIEGLKATTSEADVIQALNLSKQALDEMDGDKYIYIYDNMLSTSGQLNFSQYPELLQEEAQSVVEKLNATDSVVDLSGINVVVYGCGNTCEPQATLSSTELKNLESIWQAYFEAAGAKSVSFHSNVVTTSDEFVTDGLPEVSVVKTNGDSGIMPSITLDNESLGFVADTAEFKDVSAAKALLAEYATQLNTCPSVVITGCCAHADTDTACYELSYQRAVAVKDLLVESGISESKLTVIGAGWDTPWRVEDDEDLNRVVYLFDARSDDGKTALNLANTYRE